LRRVLTVVGLARLALTDSVPPLIWHVGRATQREPNFAGIASVKDRLSRGTPAKLSEREVLRQHSAVCLTELIRYSEPELTQAHIVMILVGAARE